MSPHRATPPARRLKSIRGASRRVRECTKQLAIIYKNVREFFTPDSIGSTWVGRDRNRFSEKQAFSAYFQGPNANSRMRLRLPGTPQCLRTRRASSAGVGNLRRNRVYTLVCENRSPGFISCQWAFPALAGMNRRRVNLAIGQKCVPRTRGDEPAAVTVAPVRSVRSPHSRG